jgi:hypothetical protein
LAAQRVDLATAFDGSIVGHMFALRGCFGTPGVWFT